ncbi:AChain A, fructan 1-exohydrolase Iia [Tanacetum coccineum]
MESARGGLGFGVGIGVMCDGGCAYGGGVCFWCRKNDIVVWGMRRIGVVWASSFESRDMCVDDVVLGVVVVGQERLFLLLVLGRDVGLGMWDVGWEDVALALRVGVGFNIKLLNKRINAHQAEEWWQEHEDRVLKKNSSARTRASSSAESFPRALWIDRSGKQLIQWPVEEIELLRENEVTLQNKNLKPGSVLEIEGVTASQFELPSGVVLVKRCGYLLWITYLNPPNTW